MYVGDDWPKVQDGIDFDGKHLLTLVRSGNSPFHGVWDVNLLIREIEENLSTQVIDIPRVSKGANNYGFHLKLSNQPDVVARLACCDVNMPNFDGLPIEVQAPEARFEVAVYELLLSEPNILASRLLFQCNTMVPNLIFLRILRAAACSCLKEQKERIMYGTTSPQEANLLTQSARIRASLFNFSLPLDFAVVWLRERLFEQKPKSLPIPVAPTREFCVALLTSKVEATIRNIGDMIGWESDNNTVGPIAVAAKQSLLRLIPHIIPTDSDESSLYRLVLDHGDFGIHNMSITMDANGLPLVTSLFDWETGSIVPAILSNPMMTVTVDLVTNEKGAPSITRVSDDTTPDELTQYMTWATQYFKALFNQAPNYEHAIKAGEDARHIWFALQVWRGDDPEGYFGDLGAWAERRMKELDI